MQVEGKRKIKNRQGRIKEQEKGKYLSLPLKRDSSKMAIGKI